MGNGSKHIVYLPPGKESPVQIVVNTIYSKTKNFGVIAITHKKSKEKHGRDLVHGESLKN